MSIFAEQASPKNPPAAAASPRPFVAKRCE